MTEQTRPLERSGSGPSGLDDIFTATPGLVTCQHGQYCERISAAGLTVAQVRRRFADRFDLGPDSRAMIDGDYVGDDTVIRDGQTLMFEHKSGEKG